MPALLIGIHLVYHLHRARIAQEWPFGSYLIGNILAIWPTLLKGSCHCEAIRSLWSQCRCMKEPMAKQGDRLHCDWCAILCPDIQWWYRWRLCHPLPCLSLELSVGGRIECPVTWTFTDCISLWCTSNALFLTDTNVKALLPSVSIRSSRIAHISNTVPWWFWPVAVPIECTETLTVTDSISV